MRRAPGVTLLSADLQLNCNIDEMARLVKLKKAGEPDGCLVRPICECAMKSSEHIIDELLVLRSQDGDRQAFEELVARWQERLWRHARLLTGDQDAAWDALQETWLAIVKGLKRLNDPAAFPKWAYKIVNDRCVDWIRRQQRQRKFEDQPPEDHRPDDLQGSLRLAMEHLPVEQRALISLHYAEGYGMAEIAEILGIPEGTVKSRLFAAREQLRKLMESL